MFPLGMVLLPTMVVPIHVFEPRYRQMTKDCLDGEREFGVVLIERGSEVGGGDIRTDTGTLARIADAQELPDGRWGLVAVGTRRIRVSRWLEDDPYPGLKSKNGPTMISAMTREPKWLLICPPWLLHGAGCWLCNPNWELPGRRQPLRCPTIP